MGPTQPASRPSPTVRATLLRSSWLAPKAPGFTSNPSFALTEQSPSDYLLYYKRATAYFSLNRHPNALEDFEKVLALTSSTFDNAFLMKAKIYAKDGRWAEARDALTHYTKKVTADQVAADLMASISKAEAAAEKAQRAKRAQLWTACTDFASSALRTAGHSVEVRQLRAECALAAGDIEGAVGDLR
jgi:DnaJ homolog subfamily C member 3